MTSRVQGMIQSAHTIAMREDNQVLTASHVLKALMDDEQGFCSNLINKSGGSSSDVKKTVDLLVQRIPKVTGSNSQPYMDNALAKVFAEAESQAKGSGDQYITVERLLVALIIVKSDAQAALFRCRRSCITKCCNL